MANESVVLWVDAENNTLLTGWESSTQSPRPSFRQGDNIKVEMHFVRRVSTNTGIFFDEVPTAGSSFRLAVGNPDAIPTGGTWTLDFDGEQADFPFNATAETVQTALNDFASIEALGGVTVEKVNGNTTFRISFNDKIALPDGFSGDGTNLLPSSTVVIDEIKVGSPTVRSVWQVKPTQVPIAYQYVWTAQSPSVITTTTLQSGTTRLKISPAPKDGTFTLSIGAFSTSPLSVFATALEVENAITAVAAGFDIQKSGAFIWDITQTTTPLVSVTANGAGLISFDSIVGEVNFNNYETATLLAGASSKATTLEIEVTTGSSVSTVLQTPVLIEANLINETIFAPTPFEERVSQSDLTSGLALKYDADNPSGFISDAPNDNLQYARQNNQWQVIELDGNNIPDYDNFVTYTVGSQVYFEGKLYRMVNAAGAAGYDPVGHPSYWESLSGSNPDLSGLRTLLDYDFTYNLGGDTYINTYGLTLNPPASTSEPYDSFIRPFEIKQSYDGSHGGTQTGYQYEAFHSISGVTVRSREWVDNEGTLEPSVGQSVVLSTNILRFGNWDGGVTNTMWYTSSNIRFPNASVQTTAFLGYDSPAFTGSVTITTGVTASPSLVITYGGTGDVVQFKDAYNDTTYSFIDGNGKVNTVASTTDNAGLRIPHGIAPTTPVNGDIWTTTSGLFGRINGVSQQYLTSTSLSDYALLSGATFTGKVNHTSVGGLAGVNIGIGGISTSATTAGDLWIATGGTNLNFRDGTGAWRVLATQGQTNTFSTNQIVSGSTTTAMLRVTQTGTGEALRVEDEANPDTSPFVVGADGRVGIHGTPATNTAHKLAIYNGNIVFSAGFGLAFGDGTTMTSAATGNVSTGVTNTFTTNQIIAGTTTSPMLRITQDGIGDALRVQDVTSDTSAFVINQNGLVGINGEPHGGTNFPLTINNGDIRFMGAGGGGVSGIMFTDGTRLTSAAGVGATTFFEMTDVNWDDSLPSPDTNGSFPVIRIGTGGVKFVEFVPSYYWDGSVSMPTFSSTNGFDTGDPATSTYATLSVTFTKPILSLHTGRISMALSPSNDYHTWSSDPSPYYNQGGASYGKFLTIRISQSAAAVWTYDSGEGWTAQLSLTDGNGNFLTGTVGDYSDLLQLVGTDNYRVYTEQTTNPYYDRPVTERGFQNALTLFLLQQNALPDPVATPRNLQLTLNEQTQLWSMTPRGVFTEKVQAQPTVTSAALNIGSAAGNPTQTVAGDIWIAGNNIFFKDSSSIQRALVNANTQNTFSTNQIISGSNSTLPMLRITQTGNGHSLVVEDSTNPDTSSFIVANNGSVAIGRDPATYSPSNAILLDVAGKANFTATASFAGLNVGVATTAPTTTVAGDVWVGSSINYKSFDGVVKAVANTNTTNQFTQGQAISVNSASNALRINQLGVGPALVVEDSTNPDTTAFVVEASGGVGIGVPAAFTATHKLEVVGAVKANSITFDGTAQFKVNSVADHGGGGGGGGGSNTHDLFISYNGSTYRIPMIFVSTP